MVWQVQCHLFLIFPTFVAKSRLFVVIFGMMIVNGMSTPNQESIRSMHKALFSNIDDDDGMAQTIATIQGLRGKHLI
jgi:hypothetical protein